MGQIVYLNDRFLPIEDAHIPVLDRGFIFGDGVYEVIPVYSRQPFRLQEHLRRLQNSLDAVRIQNPYSNIGWQERIASLIEQQSFEDQSVYLHVTRGPAPRDHAFPKHVQQTIFMMSNPLTTPQTSQVNHGVKAVSAKDFRWDRCDIKAISLLPNILLRQMAVDQDAVETVLFRDGILTEGAASNIFAVEQGTILAPPKDEHMLPGITYDVVLELSHANGIPLQIGHFEESRIRKADELWITSSTKEVLAITTLDGVTIGNGTPGPIFHQVYKLYQDYKNRVMRHSQDE